MSPAVRPAAWHRAVAAATYGVLMLSITPTAGGFSTDPTIRYLVPITHPDLELTLSTIATDGSARVSVMDDFGLVDGPRWMDLDVEPAQKIRMPSGSAQLALVAIDSSDAAVMAKLSAVEPTTERLELLPASRPGIDFTFRILPQAVEDVDLLVFNPGPTPARLWLVAPGDDPQRVHDTGSVAADGLRAFRLGAVQREMGLVDTSTVRVVSDAPVVVAAVFRVPGVLTSVFPPTGEEESEPPGAPATSAIDLALPWRSGEYWVPQTYDLHLGTTNGWEDARRAVDFYAATPNVGGVFEINEEAGRGRSCLAAHAGVAQLERFGLSPANCPSIGALTEGSLIVVRSDLPLDIRTKYIHAEPNSPIQSGDSVVVSNKGIGRRLRSGPSQGAGEIALLPDGTKLTILGGPQSAEGFDWWRAKGFVGTTSREGWIAENRNSPHVLMNSMFRVGDRIIVWIPEYVPGLPLRDKPSTSGSQTVAVLSDGQWMDVLPAEYDGFKNAVQDPHNSRTWWKLRGNVNGVIREGWAADADPGSPPGYWPTIGKPVSTGETLGKVSDQGCARSPHLMFEVYSGRDGRSGVPIPLDAPPQVRLDGNTVFPDPPPFSGECRAQSHSSDHGTIYRCTSMPRSESPSPVLTVTKTGKGQGSVTSNPWGINCGSDCQESYLRGTVVALTATVVAESSFIGWSGSPDCSDGIVTMDSDKTCTARFDAPSRTLSISKSGTGSGMITSNPAGINCGSDCQESYPQGTVVALAATAASGSSFAGWSGHEDCSDGRVTIDSDKGCTATFHGYCETHDLDGDGRAEILWKHASTRVTGAWSMSDAVVTGWLPLAVDDPGWSIEGVGDFTGDGRADILRRNSTTGEVAAWVWSSGAVLKVGMPTESTQSGWRIAGVGQIDADNGADVLWRRSTDGAIGAWVMKQNNVDHWVWMPTEPPSSGWQIVGVADITCDGRPDVVWRNSITGHSGAWTLEAAKITGWVWLPMEPASSPWQIATLIDVTGDCCADVVWRNSQTGEVGAWIIKEGRVVNWVWMPTEPPTSGWQIQGSR